MPIARYLVFDPDLDTGEVAHKCAAAGRCQTAVCFHRFYRTELQKMRLPEDGETNQAREANSFLFSTHSCF